MISRRNKGYYKFTGNQVDLETNLVSHITKTGKEQIKRRRKAGLSVYYLKDGRIIEQRPDRTEIEGKKIGSHWITLDKDKRTIILK